jgi:(p)ppGpp synthase/HD superfamily hydrolase
MPLTERFEQALVFAAQLHKQQRRKGSGVPYVSHLLSVAGLVIEHGGDEDEAIAALLHDAIEDQGGDSTREEIDRRFGPRVAGIVEGCTDTDVTPKPPWEERKRAFVARLASAPESVRLVCASDKLHNARSTLNEYRRLGDEVWERFSGGKQGSLWYYQALVEALKRSGTTPLIDELSCVVGELVALARDRSD